MPPRNIHTPSCSPPRVALRAFCRLQHTPESDRAACRSCARCAPGVRLGSDCGEPRCAHRNYPVRRALPMSGHALDVDTHWKLWRTICLRGAGFPVDMLNALVCPGLARAVDRLLDAEQAHRSALQELTRLALDRKRASQGDARRAWRRLPNRARKRGMIDYPGPDPEVAAAVARFDEVSNAVEQAERALDSTAAQDLPVLRERIRAMAREPRLREAVTWQNPDLLRVLDRLAAEPAQARTNRSHRGELLIARYAARYCAKNESIGFFGPIGWGEITDDGPAVALDHAGELITGCKVHYELWAIDALAQALFADPAARVWLAPRMHPALHVDGPTLVSLSGERLPLNPREAELITACDGTRSAGRIAAQFGEGPAAPFAGTAAVLDALSRAAGCNAVVWRADVPTVPHPDKALRRLIESVGDAALRESMHGALDSFERVRANAQSAAGNADAVRAALTEFDAQFQRLARQPPRRYAGSTIAGRTPLYLDCRRGTRIRVGARWVRELAPALALVMDAAFWYLAQLAAQLLDYVTGEFELLQRDRRGAPVTLPALWLRLSERQDTLQAVGDDVLEQLQERWGELVRVAPAQRRVDLRSADLARAARDLFDAARPGWPDARVSSPDLMIAADSVEAIERGNCLAVLGELHIGLPTLLQPVFLDSHPMPQTLLDSMQADCPEPELKAVYRRSRPGLRSSFDFPVRNHFHMEWDETLSWRPRDQVVTFGSLVVERRESGLVVRSRDGSHCFPAAAFFAPALRPRAPAVSDFFPALDHAPRVTIDRLVVARETWRLRRDALGFARARTTLARFVEARRQARELNWPRRLFYRLPGERKPLHLDLDSPISVDDFAHQLRTVQNADARIVLTEMLPAPEQSWLTDAQGRRYTGELRMVAVRRDREPDGSQL
ncbi:MAG TPA: lantibiotic dehydratase [Burkholderiales bacterium]|nr:lantibiotic dehydratase [Burkholderiales bacterium]